MEKKEFTVEDFLKQRIDLSKVCGGCKHLNITTGDCRENNTIVQYETPKCNKWRYFA